MFTGIIQGVAEVVSIHESANFRTQSIKMPQDLLSHLAIGASVANNGVCLTVTAIKDDLVSFDLMQETLAITNLGLLKEGDMINIERAMKMGDEIGGHILSGHVYCTAQLVERLARENNLQLWFELANPEAMKYVLKKRLYCGRWY